MFLATEEFRFLSNTISPKEITNQSSRVTPTGLSWHLLGLSCLSWGFWFPSKRRVSCHRWVITRYL